MQEREKIKTISYDEKSNTVTISGPFDPQELSKKLRCKACKVIKDIQVIVDPPPKDASKKEPPKEAKGKEGTKDKEGDETTKPEPCEVINDIKIILELPECPEKKPEKEPKKEKPPKEKPPKEKPDATPPTDRKPETAPSHPPIWPACCWIPCHTPYPGGSWCCSCGKVYGCVADRPPMMASSGPSHGEYCRFFYEEDPSTSCTIM